MGVGGLIGPYLVYLFEGQSYTVFGLLVAAAIPFYMKITTPDLGDFTPEERPSSVINSKAVSAKL